MNTADQDDTSPSQAQPPELPPAPEPQRGGLPVWAKVIIGVLATIGGLTLLLAAACFGMIAMNN